MGRRCGRRGRGEEEMGEEGEGEERLYMILLSFHQPPLSPLSQPLRFLAFKFEFERRADNSTISLGVGEEGIQG